MTGAAYLVETAEAGLSANERGAIEDLAAAEGIDPRILTTLAHAPDRLADFVAFYANAVTEAFPDRRLKDVVRRRVAELDPLIRRFELPADASALKLPAGLAPDEEALVRFVDAFAVDHHNVGDDVFDELRAHFSYGELMELLWTFAVIRGMARVGAIVDVPLER